MLNNLLLNGGKVLIVGGMSKSWETYKKYPQLEFWSGDQKDIVRALRNREIPQNCKAVVISRFISHAELNRVLSQARKRGITLFPNKNDGEVASILEEMTNHLRTVANGEATMTVTTQTILPTVEPEPKKSPFVKKLHLLEPFIDYTKSNSDNARSLLEKARELGIETTFGSLAQHVAVRRRKTGAQLSPAYQGQKGHSHKRIERTETPKTIVRTIEKVTDKVIEQKVDLAVKMLDSMITDLQGMRDFLISVTDENNELKKKFATLKGLFE